MIWYHHHHRHYYYHHYHRWVERTRLSTFVCNSNERNDMCTSQCIPSNTCNTHRMYTHVGCVRCNTFYLCAVVSLSLSTSIWRKKNEKCDRCQESSRVLLSRKWRVIASNMFRGNDFDFFLLITRGLYTDESTSTVSVYVKFLSRVKREREIDQPIKSMKTVSWAVRIFSHSHDLLFEWLDMCGARATSIE